MREKIHIINNFIKYVYLILSSYIYTALFRFILFVNNVEFGKNIRTYCALPKLNINKNSNVVIFGNSLLFNNYIDHSWNSKCAIYVLKKATLIIGDYSGFNGVMIFCSNNIQIGRYVKIGGGTRISDTNHHVLDWERRRNPQSDSQSKSAPIIIGDDVFVGANCYIGKGVEIGDRSIIAAGSVVIKSIPPDCIAGGNPCKVIKYLL